MGFCVAKKPIEPSQKLSRVTRFLAIKTVSSYEVIFNKTLFFIPVIDIFLCCGGPIAGGPVSRKQRVSCGNLEQ